MTNVTKAANATDVQNNFGKYLQYAVDNGEVVILKNGKRVARLVSESESVKFLTDSLCGILKGDYSEEDAKRIRTEKYAEGEGDTN